LAICRNTMHKVAKELESRAAIPFILILKIRRQNRHAQKGYAGSSVLIVNYRKSKIVY
jgi:aspartate/glutamate racemase